MGKSSLNAVVGKGMSKSKKLTKVTVCLEQRKSLQRLAVSNNKATETFNARNRQITMTFQKDKSDKNEQDGFKEPQDQLVDLRDKPDLQK